MEIVMIAIPALPGNKHGRHS